MKMGHPENLDLKSLAFTVLRKNKSVPTPVRDTLTRGTEENTPPADCGATFCAGCYAVAPGTFFHPPKCGAAFLNFHKTHTKKN
jgi:hypothetical protein